MRARNEPPVPHSWIHVYVYAVDLSTAPESVALIDHWVVHYDRISMSYPFEIDATTQPSGYYDVRLAFQVGEAQTFRIEIAEAEE